MFLLRKSASGMIDKGKEMVQTRKSDTARLTNKILEFFCSSFLVFNAKIIKLFRRTVSGQAAAENTMEVVNVVVSVKIQVR